MPNRNSKGNTPTLRRSPRFLQQNRPNAEDPKTPEPESREIRAPNWNLTPLSSIGNGSSNKSQKLKGGAVSNKAKDCHIRSKCSTTLSTGLRRSTRLKGGAEEFCSVRQCPRYSAKSKQERLSKVRDTDRGIDSCRKPKTEIDKRVTRSSTRSNGGRAIGNGKGYDGDKECIAGEDLGMETILDKRKDRGDVNWSKQCLYKIEKRVTRSASRVTKNEAIQKCGDTKGGSESTQLVSVECSDKGVLSNEGKVKQGVKLSKHSVRKPENRAKCSAIHSPDSVGEVDMKVIDNETEKNKVGQKRKKIQVEDHNQISQGWTDEQELALQRAYFAAKPTPHFWKKVAKLVPGKSAQECFDKVHSDHLTPIQCQRRSRAKGTSLLSFSLSATKLLNSSEPKSKKSRYNKQKNFLMHKTVRQLLQKQCYTGQDNKADLFAVLEPALDPSTQLIQDGTLFSTPECSKKGPEFLKRCLERSSPQRKHLSQSNNVCGAILISPPVLKQIKNKALHEKYIDQLHTREAKRKAASLRATKCIQGKNAATGNQADRRNTLKDAKSALIGDARDAINQFHHLQSSMMSNFDNTHDDFTDSTEDESEDGS